MNKMVKNKVSTYYNKIKVFFVACLYFASTLNSASAAAPTLMEISGERGVLSVDLNAPVNDLYMQRADGNVVSAIAMRLQCPIGGEFFDAYLEYSSIWRAVSLGSVLFPSTDEVEGSLPFIWPVPRCPSNGFPIAAVWYAEEDLDLLRKRFAAPFFKNEAKDHVSQYVLYRLRLTEQSTGDEFACMHASHLRLAALEASYLGKTDLRAFYLGEAVEYGRTCLTLNNNTELQIEDSVKHANTLRIMGLFDEARAAISHITNRFSNEELRGVKAGYFFPEELSTYADLLAKIDELVVEQISDRHVVRMPRPISQINPFYTEYKKLLYIKGSITPVPKP